MALDQNLAGRMLDAIEQLYIENLAYKTLFEMFGNRLPSSMQVKDLIEQAKRRPELVAKVRREFQPLRERIQNEGDLAQVIQEFLRVVPPKKDMN